MQNTLGFQHGLVCEECCRVLVCSGDPVYETLKEYGFIAWQMLLLMCAAVGAVLLGLIMFCSMLGGCFASDESAQDQESRKLEDKMRRRAEAEAAREERECEWKEERDSMEEIIDNASSLNTWTKEPFLRDGDALKDDQLVKEWNNSVDKIRDGSSDASSERSKLDKLGSELQGEREKAMSRHLKLSGIEGKLSGKLSQLSEVRQEIMHKERDRKWDELNKLYSEESQLYGEISGLESEYRCA